MLRRCSLVSLQQSLPRLECVEHPLLLLPGREQCVPEVLSVLEQLKDAPFVSSPKQFLLHDSQQPIPEVLELCDDLRLAVQELLAQT